jgi:predicted GNAT family acetyltransferase
MLAVSPWHRGQGIAQQLSLECIHRAKQDKAEVVGLVGRSQQKESAKSRHWRYNIFSLSCLTSRV